jgi:hypothetical protein
MNSMAISYNRAMELAAVSGDNPRRPRTYICFRLDGVAKNGRIPTKNIKVKLICHPGGLIGGKPTAE